MCRHARVAGAGDQLVRFVDDGRMDAMSGFDFTPSRNDNVYLERFHRVSPGTVRIGSRKIITSGAVNRAMRGISVYGW